MFFPDWLDKLSEEERETMFKAVGYDSNSSVSGYPKEVGLCPTSGDISQPKDGLCI